MTEGSSCSTKFGTEEDQNLDLLNNTRFLGRVKRNLYFVAETHLSSKCSLQRGSNNPLMENANINLTVSHSFSLLSFSTRGLFT